MLPFEMQCDLKPNNTVKLSIMGIEKCELDHIIFTMPKNADIDYLRLCVQKYQKLLKEDGVI